MHGENNHDLIFRFTLGALGDNTVPQGRLLTVRSTPIDLLSVALGDVFVIWHLLMGI